jgi:hypothetical protein
MFNEKNHVRFKHSLHQVVNFEFEHDPNYMVQLECSRKLMFSLCDKVKSNNNNIQHRAVHTQSSLPLTDDTADFE